jgi:PilZ domain
MANSSNLSSHAMEPLLRWPAKEQREALRAPYACPVRYMANGQAGQGEILNLGDGGVRIRTALHRIEIGTMMLAQISFSTPPITVPVFGLVRWVSRDGGALYEIGLQFLG